MTPKRQNGLLKTSLSLSITRVFSSHMCQQKKRTVLSLRKVPQTLKPNTRAKLQTL